MYIKNKYLNKNALLCTHQGFTDIIVCLGMMFYYSNHYNLTDTTKCIQIYTFRKIKNIYINI